MRSIGILSAPLLLVLSVPTLACAEASPAAQAWAQCGYAVGYRTGDHLFIVRMAKTMDHGKKLKPSSISRWQEIEKRIEAACGSYDVAQARDTRDFHGKMYIPDDQFSAIVNTDNLDKLVKSNA